VASPKVVSLVSLEERAATVEGEGAILMIVLDANPEDYPSIPESNCVVCSAWPKADRAWLRKDISCIPLREPICDPCLVAFWQRLGVRVSDA
jgi:hypothetical protein